MKVEVSCESGYSGCDRPKSLVMDGCLHTVTEIIREWREPGAKHFILLTSRDLKLKVAFFERTGQWSALEILYSPQ